MPPCHIQVKLLWEVSHHGDAAVKDSREEEPYLAAESPRGIGPLAESHVARLRRTPIGRKTLLANIREHVR